MFADSKIAWVALNTALTKVENAVVCLNSVPSLGDEDALMADSLDSFIGLIVLDLMRVRAGLVTRIADVEKVIRDGEVQYL